MESTHEFSFEALTSVPLWRLEHHESESFLKRPGEEFKSIDWKVVHVDHVMHVFFHVGGNQALATAQVKPDIAWQGHCHLLDRPDALAP